jgi:hypothetical protein
MKSHYWILSALMAVTLVFVGCSKQEGAVDTAPIERSFKSADADLQSSANKAVAAIKSADYAGAMTELQALAREAKLTPEQQQAIQDVLAQVQRTLSDTAAKAADEAGKAFEGMKDALPKSK